MVRLGICQPVAGLSYNAMTIHFLLFNSSKNIYFLQLVDLPSTKMSVTPIEKSISIQCRESGEENIPHHFDYVEPKELQGGYITCSLKLFSKMIRTYLYNILNYRQNFKEIKGN